MLARGGLASLQCALGRRALSQHAPATASLWDRMGGERVIRPMVGELVDLHTSDPLTKNYFGGGKFANNGTREHVVNRVFTFFSAGIGGPHKYEGKDMVSAHIGMKITGPAMHALTNHVLVKMEAHKAGGAEEREEVLGILYSLKDEVLKRNGESVHKYDPKSEPTSGSTVAESRAPADASLWDRMGGENVIRPMVNELVALHFSDPLTGKWFGPKKFNNDGSQAFVIERVFTFFSAGIGGPYKYEGKDMATAHLGMKLSKASMHALINHVMVKMEQHRAGGHREREEVLDILYSLKAEVLKRSEEPQPSDGVFAKFDPHA